MNKTRRYKTNRGDADQPGYEDTARRLQEKVDKYGYVFLSDLKDVLGVRFLGNPLGLVHAIGEHVAKHGLVKNEHPMFGFIYELPREPVFVNSAEGFESWNLQVYPTKWQFAEKNNFALIDIESMDENHVRKVILKYWNNAQYNSRIPPIGLNRRYWFMIRSVRLFAIKKGWCSDRDRIAWLKQYMLPEMFPV